MAMELVLHSLAETEAFGRRLGEALFPGAVIALIGPMGAGKTHLVKAIAEGLGIRNSGLVTSPTFVLIQEYEARLPIYHFDAYRLSGEEEFRALGTDEYLYGDGVCLIEWADRVWGAMPEEYLKITLAPIDTTQRTVTLVAFGTRYNALIHGALLESRENH